MCRKRDDRNLQSGHIYHIYNRGNNKKVIAKEFEDYSFYVNLMFNEFYVNKQDILSYCFMPNHYHFLVMVQNEIDFVSLMHSFGFKSARYFNKKYNAVGHLWQDRYKHRLIQDEADLLGVSRYIHLNPFEKFESKLTTEILMEYEWSSLPCYLGKNDARISKSHVLDCFKSESNYADYLLGKHLSTLLKVPHADKLQDYRSVEEKRLFESICI